MLKELFRQIYDSHIWDDITVDRFKEKFGEELYKQFTESRDRLKNAGMSLNVNDYVKDPEWTPQTLQAKLDELERNVKMHRRTLNEDKKGQIVGKYNYYGIHGGYAVYEPLDVEASVSMGVNTGWCTTGRHGHAGQLDFKPSYDIAAKHFNDYRQLGRLIYFLNPSNNYGEWAIFISNKPQETGRLITLDNTRYQQVSTNFEIYNAKDELDYSNLKIAELTEQLLGLKSRMSVYPLNVAGPYVIGDSTLITSDDKNIRVVNNIPDNVISIGSDAFKGCNQIISVNLPDSIETIGNRAFNELTTLKELKLSSNLRLISDDAFFGCGIQKLVLPEHIEQIGSLAFADCKNLSFIYLPKHIPKLGLLAFDGCSALKEIHYNGTKDEFRKQLTNDITQKNLYHQTKLIKCLDGDIASEDIEI